MNTGSVSRPATIAAAVAARILPATAAGQQAAGPAQRSAPVTLGEAIRRASESHPSLRESDAGTEAARARLDALRDAVRQAEEVARIEKLRLETGRAVQPDYLDAEARLMSARATRAEAEHAVVRARVQLARITGELDAGWVEENIRTGGSGR